MALHRINQLIQSTVQIWTDDGFDGTGFLMFRQLREDVGHVFIVTNKHVIEDCLRPMAPSNSFNCSFNGDPSGGSPKIINARITIRHDDGKVRFRQHHDEAVDVVAIAITDLIVDHPEISKTSFGYDLLGTPDLLKREEVTVGEALLIIGYPNGYRAGNSALPLVRNAYISTMPGQLWQETLDEGTPKERVRTMDAFVIDGGVIGGSSGSPVFLRPSFGRVKGGTICPSINDPILLGMITETRYAAIDPETIGFAGLGVALNAQTIKDVIEAFFSEDADDLVSMDGVQRSA